MRLLKILYSIKARRNLAKKPESTISELYKLTKGLQQPREYLYKKNRSTRVAALWPLSFPYSHLLLSQHLLWKINKTMTGGSRTGLDLFQCLILKELSLFDLPDGFPEVLTCKTTYTDMTWSLYSIEQLVLWGNIGGGYLSKEITGNCLTSWSLGALGTTNSKNKKI